MASHERKRGLTQGFKVHFILAVADVGVLPEFTLTRLQHAGINRAFRRCKVHGKKVHLNAESGEVFLRRKKTLKKTI
jgi:hypothetical protein